MPNEAPSLPHLELLSCSFDLSLLCLGYSRHPNLSYKLKPNVAHFNLLDPLF
jgi:hypothetical protein